MFSTSLTPGEDALIKDLSLIEDKGKSQLLSNFRYPSILEHKMNAGAFLTYVSVLLRRGSTSTL